MASDQDRINYIKSQIESLKLQLAARPDRKEQIMNEIENYKYSLRELQGK